MVCNTFYSFLPPVILASRSPRRAALLAQMGIPCQVQPSTLDERTVPPQESGAQQAKVLAWEKASQVHSQQEQPTRALVIGADTIVECKHTQLDKPLSHAQALHTLTQLSDTWHWVHTGVALLYGTLSCNFVESTRVHFAPLSQQEIAYYVEQYAPLDKAGAYGIQEWIGVVGITHIEGSYENVMGLPTQRLHAELIKWFAQ